MGKQWKQWFSIVGRDEVKWASAEALISTVPGMWWGNKSAHDCHWFPDTEELRWSYTLDKNAVWSPKLGKVFIYSIYCTNCIRQQWFLVSWLSLTCEQFARNCVAQAYANMLLKVKLDLECLPSTKNNGGKLLMTWGYIHSMPLSAQSKLQSSKNDETRS